VSASKSIVFPEPGSPTMPISRGTYEAQGTACGAVVRTGRLCLRVRLK
jgi:hypothetical protein